MGSFLTSPSVFHSIASGFGESCCVKSYVVFKVFTTDLKRFTLGRLVEARPLERGEGEVEADKIVD